MLLFYTINLQTLINTRFKGTSSKIYKEFLGNHFVLANLQNLKSKKKKFKKN